MIRSFIPLLLSATAPPADVGDVVEQATGKIDDLFNGGFVGFLILIGVVALISFVLIKLLQRFSKRHFSGNLRIFYRILYLVIILIAVLVVLSDIKPLQRFGTAMLTGSGIAAVVLGLAAQQTLGNVFSGISISANHPFYVGELIELIDTDPAISGTVKEIGLRHTTITDFTNKDIVIPNSVLDKRVIRTSHSARDTGIVNYLTVTISYASDLDAAIALLQNVCDAHKSSIDMRTDAQKRNNAPKTIVHVMDLGETGVALRASVWTESVASGFDALSDLRRSLKQAFEQSAIEIPYPYENVILRENSKRDRSSES